MLKKHLCIVLMFLAVLAYGENKHPRMLMDDNAFAAMKEKVEASADLTKLHTEILSLADKTVRSDIKVTFTLDASKKRLIGGQTKATEAISLCAYAYRFTADDKYLKKAEEMLLALCALPGWNHERHTLNSAEIGAFVAMGYDWLYHHLSEGTKATVEEKLLEYFLKPISNGIWSLNFQKVNHNWNQVCNAGVVCAALVLDNHKDLTEPLLEQAVKTNMRAVRKMYSPEGNYPEGPGYWGYGTIYQILLIDALQSCLGHDYGISAIEGFARTGDYKLAVKGPGKKVFNYSDNGAGDRPDIAMWFFADRYGNPSYLYRELMYIEEGEYISKANRKKFAPLLMAHVANIDIEAVSSPSQNMYVGYGENPVVMIHTDWSLSETDKFLGIKAGTAKCNHGHLDAGSFVFDAEGIRWASDLSQQPYATLENTMKAMGGTLFKMKQDSPRWKVFRYNNRQHNTLTINNTDHKVTGKAPITGIIDTDDRKGASIDLTEIFEGEAASVRRDIELVKGDDLMVTDIVKALDSKDAQIRWTMVSTSTPKITRKGIRLENGGKTRFLKVKGTDVRYRIFESDPKKLNDIPMLREKEEYEKGTCIVGFTFTIPAGTEKTVITTLTK